MRHALAGHHHHHRTLVVKGATANVGAISGVDGKKQITMNGWPIYTFAKDTTLGSTAG